ncbi:terpene synthase 5-like [Euphorbia lathyris]|uniref:terpene synthase 5-like n=1 Tax=Euphorbia lathyris TaxID=212925 RepID=UPI003313AC70
MAELEHDVLRGASKNLPTGVWGYSFASISPLDSELESYTKKVDAIKEKVKDMLIQSTKELANIEFIDLLCRLGVSYHFENEIDSQLNRIFTTLPNFLEHNNYELHTLATLFRVLRQHGYKMTSDVFKKFKDKNGKFKSSMIDDVKGLLCLYEACFLAVDGEDILEEALSFTRKHLKSLAENLSHRFQKHIRNALIFPYQRTMERLGTLHYIFFYEADESPNETLLKFAKLDFNRLQLLYRKELALLSIWWKNTNVVESLPYGRDRLVMSYIWAVGSIFEPQYSLSRMIICKYVLLSTVVDDTYDTYGTFDELCRFTTALQKFNTDVVDQLPDYMKFLYKFILTFFEETEKDSGGEGCFYKASFAREMLKELATSYFVEKNWQRERKAPLFKEYMEHGLVTSTLDFISSALIQGIENLGMKEILWIRNNPQIIIAAKFCGRLMNDLAVRTDETNRDDFPKAVDCYMEEHRVSRDEAIESIVKIIENKWKKINEEMMKPSSGERILIKLALNYSRMAMLYYNSSDMFTYESSSQELVMSIIINPISM